MSTGAVLTAAGSGSRLGAGVPKAFVSLDGTPLVVHAARRLGLAGVRHLAVAAPVGLVGEVTAHLRADASASPIGTPGWRLAVVDGGPSRQASVAAALAALGPDVDVVLVHDAARALAPVDLISRVERAVRGGHDAVVPGLYVADTVKEVATPAPDGGAAVVRTPDRSRLRAVQTPQGFRRAVLEAAHEAGAARAADEDAAATDDAALVEAIGLPVWVVPGDPDAMKITTRRDLLLAELLLRGGVA